MSLLNIFKSGFKNCLKIFYKPREVFQNCKENSNWLVPLLLVIIICFISAHLIVNPLIIPNQIERVNSNSLSEEQKEGNIAFLESSYHVFSTYISTTFTKVIYYLILAFFLSLTPLIFKGEGIKYKYVFSAVIYTGIINSLGFLIDSIIKLNHGSLDIGLNLALIFDNLNGGRLEYLFGAINLFGIWQVFLLALLLSVFYGYKKFKSFAIIFNAWLILKILQAYFLYLKATL